MIWNVATAAARSIEDVASMSFGSIESNDMTKAMGVKRVAQPTIMRVISDKGRT